MELFCITTALIIVFSNLALSRLEAIDQRKGLPTRHEDYTLWGAIKLLFKKKKK